MTLLPKVQGSGTVPDDKPWPEKEDFGMRARGILASLFVAGALSLNFAAADALRPASALIQSTNCGQHDGPLCSITRGCNIIFIPPFIFVPYCWEVVKYYPAPRPPDEETDEEPLEG